MTFSFEREGPITLGNRGWQVTGGHDRGEMAKHQVRVGSLESERGL